jgi:hypothetical protein
MSLLLPFDSPLLTGMKKIRLLKRQWPIAAKSANLSMPSRGERTRVPTLHHTQITSPNGLSVSTIVDLSSVGNTSKNLEDKLDIILASLEATGGRVERITPGRARLHIEWERRSRLTTTGTLREGEDPGAIDISPYWIDLDNARDSSAVVSLTKSILIGGESESGKSNMVWHLISELNSFSIPYRLSVIDPAGGVELNDLEHSPYTRRYVDRASDVQPLVDLFHKDMNDRLEWMKSNRVRTHNPSPQKPLEILVIDELLLCKDQLKDGALSPLGEVLSVGRKARFIVWGCSQLGQKESIGAIRDLFTQRVCLRTRTQETTDAVLGTGATGDGAKCHRISRPGEGYVWTDSSASYQKFYAPLVVETYSVAQGGISSPLLTPTKRTPKSKVSKTAKLHVFKLFSDYDHHSRPVYIGLSEDPRKTFRQLQQEHPKSWQMIIPQRTEIIPFEDRLEALKHQQELIAKIHPPFNDTWK